MRISDWSSDVCSSDLDPGHRCLDAFRRDFGGRPLVAGGEREVEEAVRVVEARPQQLAARQVLVGRRNAPPHRHPRGVERLAGTEARQRGAKIGRAHVELQSLMRISYAVFCLNKKIIAKE